VSFTENRRSVRRWVRINAEIVTADDFTRIGGRLVDLSEHGARVEVDQRVVVGERLFISFEMPGVGMVDIEAVAAHIGFDKRSGKRTVGVGFEHCEERAALSTRLSKIPPTLPSKPGQSGDTYQAVSHVSQTA
jgi:hypothetical protein